MCIKFEDSELSKNFQQEECNLEPVGTRIVDLDQYDHFFDFESEPDFSDERIFYRDAISKNLYISYKKYNALVVNKMPHGGGIQPPRSHRGTLFLYLVPMNWKDEFELEVTIPATDFLFKMKDNNIDFNSFNNIRIKEWSEVIPDIFQHYDGEVDEAKRVYEEKKKLQKYIKDICKK